MLSITIPLWLMLAAAGLPSLTLCFLIIRLVRLRSKKRALNAAQAQSTVTVQPQSRFEGFGGHIHQELLEQQIDAVFNALATVLETERLKLKALVNHALPALATIPHRPSQSPVPATINDAPDESRQQVSEPSIGQQVAAMSGDGMTAVEIARQLGLSQAEITLAMKMNGKVGSKMRAVA